MMFLLLSIAVILPIMIGFLLVSFCWPDLKPTLFSFWCKLSVAIGVGFGITSFTSFFTLLLVGTPSFPITFAVEIVILGALLGIWFYRKKPLIFTSQMNFEQGKNTALGSILSIAFYVSLIFAIGMFLLRSLENPHGEPDAWTFWNLRARLFFRSGIRWRMIFAAGDWPFPKYPLLIPTNVVRFWSYMGKESLMSAPIIAFLFTFATIGLLVSALVILRGRTQGFIGGLILSSTPYFIKHGASQYTDVPLGFYILATVVLLNLQEEMSEKPYGIACLVGIVIGFAAWTKNEGFLLLGSVVVAHFLTILVFKAKITRYRQEALSFLGGIFPILLVIMYFKRYIAPHNSPMSFLNMQQVVEWLTDFSRYLYTGKAFLRQIVEPYSLVYSTPIAIFFVYVVFLGLNLKQVKRPGVFTSGLTLCFMLCEYFFLLIGISANLTLMVTSSLSRLFLQLWPSIMFFFLLIIANPEEQNRRRSLSE